MLPLKIGDMAHSSLYNLAHKTLLKQSALAVCIFIFLLTEHYIMQLVLMESHAEILHHIETFKGRWTSQGLTDTFWWSLEHGRTYEQSAQIAGDPSEVRVHQGSSS